MNVVVTSFNSPYFDAGMTLIASIHRTSREMVDKILAFDLGLTRRERALVRECRLLRSASRWRSTRGRR